jgi:8-oxo-dGTP pyrophosphatase MutT (NUDIX family)
VRTAAGVEICLIRPAGRTVWGLPKGGVESGETLPQTALREVAEETGIEGEVDRELGSIDYSFYSREASSRIHKTVHYYLMHATGGDTAHHDHEVSEARWVPLAEALKLMTYPNEREMVRRAADALGAPADG